MSSSSSPTDMYKAIDDAWIGLLVLAIFILAVSLSAIIALCLLWHRYQRARRLFQASHLPSPKMTNRRAIPVQIDEYPNTGYETQVVFDLFLSRLSTLFAVFGLENGSVCAASRRRKNGTQLRRSSRTFLTGRWDRRDASVSSEVSEGRTAVIDRFPSLFSLLVL